jgi:hypothetical protein
MTGRGGSGLGRRMNMVQPLQSIRRARDRLASGARQPNATELAARIG